jgi:hypothetical protein
MNKFLDEYTNKLFQYIYNKDSNGLISMLENDKQFETNFKNITSYEQLIQSVTNLLNSKFNNQQNSEIHFSLEIKKYLTDFLTYFLLYKNSINKKEYIQSFENMKNSFSNFCEFYMLYDESSLAPLLKYFIRILYNIGEKCDESNKISSNELKYASELGTIIISFFNKFSYVDDNTKYSVLFGVVCLMRIYFKLKNYRYSIPLVQWYNKKQFDKDEDNIPSSELCTFSFYQGRLTLYELDLLESQKILNKAFDICLQNINNSKSCFINAKLIYEYLIPLNIFFGLLPLEEEIEKFKLDPKYITLVNSIKNGDINKFDKVLDDLEDRFIDLGTFLIIGKFRPYVYRNLIKIIYEFIYDESKQTIIMELDLVHTILKNVYNYEIDKEELEINIIGVLYRGLIGGYIHYKNKVIVFGKNNPFPNLKETFNKNYNKII